MKQIIDQDWLKGFLTFKDLLNNFRFYFFLARII